LVGLYPRVEAKQRMNGHQERIFTPGCKKRKNVFVMLFWPKKYGFVWNKFEKSRSRDFRQAPSLERPSVRGHGMNSVIPIQVHPNQSRQVRNSIHETHHLSCTHACEEKFRGPDRGMTDGLDNFTSYVDHALAANTLRHKWCYLLNVRCRDETAACIYLEACKFILQR